MTTLAIASIQTISADHLVAVTGGDLQGFIDGAKRVGDTAVKAAGYGAVGGGIVGAVVGSPGGVPGAAAGAGAGAALGAAAGGAFGIGWGAAREIDHALHPRK